MPEIVKDAIPIIWFGDIDKYFESEIRTITVGINPSDKEFSPTPNERFPDSSTLSAKRSLNSSDRALFEKNMNDYFQYNPYKGWFNNYDNQCMKFFSKIYDVGYGMNGNCPKNTAIHVDCLSALATCHKWKDLQATTKSVLEKENAKLFKALIEFLDPNVILFSTSKDNFEKIICGIYGNIGIPGVAKAKIKSYLINGRLIIWGRNMR